MSIQFPGRDEITLSTPRAQHLCNNRAHRQAGRLAALIVTFGILADPSSDAFSPDALWIECWGHAYPLCAECWDNTRRIATSRRPALVIRDLTSRPPLLPFRRNNSFPNGAILNNRK